MKVRVKATDEIIEVDAVRRFSNARGSYIVYIDVRTFKEYDKEEVDTKDLTTLAEVRHMHTVDPDYWTRLEHQYAGMAMQGILSNMDLLISLAKKKTDDYPAKYTIAEFAKDCAHALVEKIKEEK